MLRKAIFFILIFAAGGATALASVDTGLLALVPQGSRVVSAVDVSRARNSRFGELLMDRVAASDNNFESFLSKTGFDMSRDVQDFVFAGPGNSEGAILARGHFDLNRIKAAAKSHGCVVETYRGVTLVLNSGHTNRSALAFPAPRVAVIANIATVEKIIRGRNVPASLDTGLKRLIAGVGKDNDAWFASLSAGALAAPQVSQKNHTAAAAIRTIQQASGGLRFADPIPVTIDAATGSSAEAEALSVVIRGMAALARIGHPSDPYLATLAAAQNLNIDANGNTVHLSFSLAEKDAERIIQLLPNSGSKAQQR